MGIEIERKFLVVGDSWRSRIIKSANLKQGYFLVNGPQDIRVRIREGRASLTIKGNWKEQTRAEFEYSIPVEDAIELMEMCSNCLEKRRHLVRDRNLEWIVDEFSFDSGVFYLAEIELSYENQPIETPDWLGSEVTGLREFDNAALALRQAGPRFA